MLARKRSAHRCGNRDGRALRSLRVGPSIALETKIYDDVRRASGAKLFPVIRIVRG